MKKIFTILLTSIFFFSVFSSFGTDDSFRVKGFHLDFRTEVMTIDAMKAFARQLSGMQINTLVMEWEGTFPYSSHATISNPLSFTRAEVLDFVSYCESLGIDVIPLQQCFGHVEYILRHPRYQSLREEYGSELSQICPLKSESVALFRELFSDISSLHKSPYIHIGGDETYLLGRCSECKSYSEREGKSKLFVNYIKQICEIVISLGKRPVLWGDIITKYPEAVKELPAETILVDWNYGWNIRRFGNIDKIYASGLEIWGAPSIRSNPDNYYLTSWIKHFNNQRDFIPYAREAGYKGLVMTSWSTSGLYGFLWEPGNEVVSMDPIRLVYPMSGFNLLIEMYGASLNQSGPIDPELFVKSYAQDRFGFSEEESQSFWEILSTPQQMVQVNNRANTEKERDQSVSLRDRLYDMVPRKNKKEYEHLKLMFDIRVQYLEFKVLESVMNSSDFTRSKAPALLKEMEQKVLGPSRDLEKRFIQLNQGYLKFPELEYQNAFRMRKINQTVSSLRRML